MMQKTRGLWIAGNWKMNHGPKELKSFFSTLQNHAQATFSSEEQLLLKSQKLHACLFPSYLSLENALLESNSLSFPLEIGAQNASGELSGAFTGEVSGPMLQSIGIHSVLIGHSERRQLFGETLAILHMKLKKLLAQNFRVFFCIGETLTERERKETDSILRTQLQTALEGLLEELPQIVAQQRFVIAYEPVWAIGTGLTATPEQANEAHLWIRKILKKDLSSSAWSEIPILYGGSVTPDNVHSLLACSEVDGVLVGGSSLKAQSFLSLLKAGIETL